MNNETGPVFIDGEVNAEIVGRFKNRQLFSASENKELEVSEFQLGNNFKDQLKLKIIDQVVDFYNRFNSSFLKLKDSTGVNVWFLEHFRINFKFIERIQTEELKKAFLEEHPDGAIVQSNHTLASANSSSRILKEVLFIIQNSLSRTKKISGTILVHNEGGPDFSASELFGELTNHFPTFKIRSLFDLKRNLPMRSKFAGFPNSDALFLKTLISPRTWLRVKRFRLEVDFLVNGIENEPLDSLEIEIVQHLKSKKSYFTLLYLKYLSFQNFFEDANIESVILSDENSPQQKVIQYAAKETDVNIFAIQHGAIYNNHFGYTYGKYHNPPILPDITFTWGDYYSEVLLKYGGYKAEQVKAVGSLRKSGTPAAESSSRDKNTQVVLFATQPIPNETLRKQYLKDVFYCFLTLGERLNYQLIIRPHPNEKDDQYFADIANEVGFSNYSIERNVTMEDQFIASDVLITAYSTVGAEYVEYFKPIVVLDYLNEDLAGYLKEGVGVPVSNGNELIKVFEQQVIEVDVQKYKRFIVRFFHASDGKAADRILKVLGK